MVKIRQTPVNKITTAQTENTQHRHTSWLAPSKLAGSLVLVCALALWLWSAIEQVIPSAIGTSLTILIPDLLLALGLATIISLALRFTLGRRRHLPLWYIWACLASFILLITMRAGASQLGWYVTVLSVITAGSVIGGYAGHFLASAARTKQWSPRKRQLCGGGFAIACLLVVAAVAWYAIPGTAPSSVANAAQHNDVQPAGRIDAPDPSEPGPFNVEYLTYGSGTDKQRPEYNSSAAIKSNPVDASKIISGWGADSSARAQLWGFTEKSFPINGRVWYPRTDGPSPLVIIVHGNNNSAVFSDPGYEYIGRQLASQGFIVASIDENFLNTGLIDKSGGLSGASAARGWLVLEHLRQWTAWNNQPDGRFYDKIDTDNVALIGHSRGGEAVAIAADFNQRTSYPENPDLHFDYGYAIKSVVAIAPAEGQYKPGGKGVEIRDTNYLTLQGSYDADVTTFGGLNQYERVRLTAGSGYFKSALYIDRANHDQFNTLWGRYDVGKGLAKYFLNTKSLLSPADQQHIAKTYTSAFLLATLKNQVIYSPLFQNYRSALTWLPHTIYQNLYADARTTYISQDTPGAAVKSTGFAQSVREPLKLRLGSGDNRVTALTWDNHSPKGVPRHSITLPEDLTTSATETLRFDAADATPNSTRSDRGFNIVATDGNGTEASIPLMQLMPLQSPLRNNYLKQGLQAVGATTEPVMQTYSIPLSMFAHAMPGFDVSTLSSVSFVFQGSQAGTVLLDAVGLSSKTNPTGANALDASP